MRPEWRHPIWMLLLVMNLLGCSAGIRSLPAGREVPRADIAQMTTYADYPEGCGPEVAAGYPAGETGGSVEESPREEKFPSMDRRATPDRFRPERCTVGNSNWIVPSDGDRGRVEGAAAHQDVADSTTGGSPGVLADEMRLRARAYQNGMTVRELLLASRQRRPSALILKGLYIGMPADDFCRGLNALLGLPPSQGVPFHFRPFESKGRHIVVNSKGELVGASACSDDRIAIICMNENMLGALFGRTNVQDADFSDRFIRSFGLEPLDGAPAPRIDMLNQDGACDGLDWLQSTDGRELVCVTESARIPRVSTSANLPLAAEGKTALIVSRSMPEDGDADRQGAGLAQTHLEPNLPVGLSAHLGADTPDRPEPGRQLQHQRGMAHGP